MQNTKTIGLANIGCWLDNHRGHYISRDVIQLAQGFGFIIGPSDEFVVAMYDHSYDLPDGVEYPHETVIEMADEAVAWLNSSPTEREISGQNMPPVIPDGYGWDYNDGDFGLYSWTEDERVENAEDEHDVCPDCGNTGTMMTAEGYRPCFRYVSCWADD